MIENEQLSAMTQSAMSFTKTITTRWNSRLAGSKACLECAEYLNKYMAGFCDSTGTQEFSVRPGAFLGYIRINIVLYFLGLAALYFRQLELAVTLASLSMLITILEFFIYKEFVDPLFSKKNAINVFGTLEPSGKILQQIIISAHHDSAHIFNFLEKDPLSYNRKVLSATLTQLAMFILAWILLFLQILAVPSEFIHWLVVGLLTLASVSLIPFWFFYDPKGTPGAGDNLVCTALAMEIGKYFAQQKQQSQALKHTRIMISSWDAEECGLRGARAFTKKYKDDLLKLKTFNLNLECMYDHNEMRFLTSDLNNFVPLSKKMAEECTELSRQLGFSIGTSPFPFLGGGTDAAEFAKIGVEATTLAAMNWTKRDQSSAYHTTRDTIEAVDKVAVARSIALGIQYVLQKDREIMTS